MAGEVPSPPLGIDPSGVQIDAGTLARTRTPAPGPSGLKAKEGAAGSDAGSIGDRVLRFAQRQRQRRVGNGQCTALADSALRHAGARSVADFGPVTEDGDYVWGTAVELPQVQPGDIVQFRDYEYIEREDEDDGNWRERSETRPHHTAIVASAEGNGMLTVIEQNAPEGSPVHQTRLGFASGMSRSGGSTTRRTVNGQVCFYRAQPR